MEYEGRGTSGVSAWGGEECSTTGERREATVSEGEGDTKGTSAALTQRRFQLSGSISGVLVGGRLWPGALQRPWRPGHARRAWTLITVYQPHHRSDLALPNLRTEALACSPVHHPAPRRSGSKAIEQSHKYQPASS